MSVSDNLGSFASSINVISKEISANGPKAAQTVANAILQAVVIGTPVGNPVLWKFPDKAHKGYVGGKARANWLVALGSPISDPVDDIDPSGGSTISAGAATISGATASGSVINISNNLPYIQPLNDGHSLQAPIGWIDQAIQAGVAAIAGVTLLSA